MLFLSPCLNYLCHSNSVTLLRENINVIFPYSIRHPNSIAGINVIERIRTLPSYKYNRLLFSIFTEYCLSCIQKCCDHTCTPTVYHDSGYFLSELYFTNFSVIEIVNFVFGLLLHIRSIKRLTTCVKTSHSHF